MKFRKRIRGTPKQIGKAFPVLEKKKLPKLMPGRAAGLGPALAISSIKFEPPSEGREGLIEFFMDGNLIRHRVIVENTDKVGCFAKDKPIVFIDDDVPPKYMRSLSLHEGIESYLAKRYGLDPNKEGHAISEWLEFKEFRKTGGMKDWRAYDSLVKYASKISGGKLPSRGELNRALIMLAEKRRQEE